MDIAQNIKNIKASIPAKVALIAVSKTNPVNSILEAYDSGQRAFGENKIQEMIEKYEQLPKDIQWHMIGHLQTNKIKYIVHFVHLIHGVDSIKKLEEINKQAIKHNRIIHCLLQIKIAQEDTKFGMTFEEAETLLRSKEIDNLSHICVEGFMGMASFTKEKSMIRYEFKQLKDYFDHTKKYESANFKPTTLSMGMSGDYKIAIAQGSNMIRVGSLIFGERNYN